MRPGIYIAAVGKYVWNIACKADNLWVKWVNHKYLKGNPWWEYDAPALASCSWKQVVRVKNTHKDGFHHQTSKWIDCRSGNYSIVDAYKWLTNEDSPNLP